MRCHHFHEKMRTESKIHDPLRRLTLRAEIQGRVYSSRREEEERREEKEEMGEEGGEE